MGLRLTDAKIILFSAMFFQQLDECFYRKRIMLCGDTELMADRGSAEITLFDQCRLLDHLSGVPEKFLSFSGNDHAFIGPAEDRDAQFLFQLFDRRPSGWAGVKNQPLRRLADRGTGRDGHGILQLQ